MPFRSRKDGEIDVVPFLDVLGDRPLTDIYIRDRVQTLTAILPSSYDFKLGHVRVETKSNRTSGSRPHIVRENSEPTGIPRNLVEQQRGPFALGAEFGDATDFEIPVRTRDGLNSAITQFLAQHIQIGTEI